MCLVHDILCQLCQVELVIFGVRVSSAGARALSGLVLSPHSHGRFELFAPLGNPTEMFCSNGLIGVEDDDGLVCCEAQCGRCGGSRCGRLPGGPVRWCLAIFVSYLSDHAPSAKRAVLFVLRLDNRGKVAGTQASTNSLATVLQERYTTQARQHRQV